MVVRFMVGVSRQLVFELAHREALELEDFLVSDSNAEAVALIDRWPDWPAGAAVIAGPAGSGKSHLANVWRAKTGALVVEAADVTKARVPDFARAARLVVENVRAGIDEQALFHLLNLVREEKLSILITAERAPGDLGIALPDLNSRLKALPLAIILPPDDALLRAVLVKLFADRQLSVEPAIIDYIVVRMERSFAAARAVVAEIDRLALQLKRSVTRAIAAAALESLGFSQPMGN
jgi:chromosomal replication initiation ATPase DnaA